MEQKTTNTAFETKVTWKMYVNDWRFWYKVVFMIWSIAMTLYPILWSWIHIAEVTIDGKPVYALYDSTGAFVGYNYWAYFVYTFTFFTCQSNILVMIWLIAAVILYPKEGKVRLLKANFSVAVATYITLTCLLAMVYMLPLGLISGAVGSGSTTANPMPMGGSGMKDGSIGLFMQLSLHLFIPIGFVLYVALFLCREKIMSKKAYMEQMWWRVIIYPVCYIVMVMISGALIHASHNDADMKANPQYYILENPYFFFYVWQNGGANGWPLSGFKIGGAAWAVITCIIMLGIVLGFSYLYNLAGLRRQTKVLLPAGVIVASNRSTSTKNIAA